jgi:hypothetical protein
MNHPRLALLSTLLLSSCVEPQSLVDTNEEEDTDESEEAIQLSGDQSLEDLENYCEDFGRVDVNGSVSLDTSTETDLSSVDCLGSVTGDLVIDGDELTTIDLPNLEQVGSDLVVNGLNSLETLNLDALEAVGGNLNLVSNPYLDVASLAEICDAGASIVITDNPELTELNLASLETVNIGNTNGRTGETDEVVQISNHALLEGLDLGKLHTMNASLLLENNASLSAIDVGSAIDTSENGNLTIAGDLKIADNAKLESVNFPLLASVQGDLKMYNMPDLVSNEDSFAALTSIEGDLHLDLLPRYDSPHFENLATIGGKVYFHDVGSNADSRLDLGALTSVGGDITFSQLSVNEISLSSLLSTEFDVTFSHNATLESVLIRGEATWNGDLYLIGNDSLENLASFASLQTIGGTLEIRENVGLIHLEHLLDVSSIRDAAASGKEDCVTEPSVLICGNPHLNYESSCNIVERLIENEIISDDAYIYENDECTEECLDEFHHQDFVCLPQNLDDDGDGYSEEEGDCDDDPDTGSSTHPFAGYNEDNKKQCMTDADGDGWGSCTPRDAVTPGTDCLDSDAAKNNDDVDEDGFSTCDSDCDDDDPLSNPDTGCSVSCVSECN